MSIGMMVNFLHIKNQFNFFHPDHLGSSTFLSDESGQAYQFLLYLPWGESMAEQKAGGYTTPYKYTGKELDEEIGMYDYGARFYDPSISLWTSVDPLTEKYPSFSAYNYVMNNPIKYIDPDGKEVDDPIYNTRGKKIGDDGKDNNRAYIVRGKTKRQVKAATKLGQNYKGNLERGDNVFKVPTGGAMDDVISTVVKTRGSGKENGGHIETGSKSAALWDEGPAPSVKSRHPDGTPEKVSATIKFFTVNGKQQGYADTETDLEFWWHTHPDVDVEGVKLGSHLPSESDYFGQKLMEDKGFKGNTFVIGLRTNKVSFYNKDRNLLTIPFLHSKKSGA